MTLSIPGVIAWLVVGMAPPAAAPISPVEPLGPGGPQQRDDRPPAIVEPLPDTTNADVRPPDPRDLRIVRLDFMVGPLWRVRELDPMISTSLEVGAQHGFSGTFHTQLIVARQTDDGSNFGEDLVRALDVPIGVGAVARGKVRKRQLYGSIGVTGGILVHRAKAEGRLVHRVDPDFRVPIRLAWTIATVGFSLVLEQGFSVRSRSYERRGSEVWSRHAYRIGFMLGLHSDIRAGRAALGRTARRSRSRR